MKYSGIYKPNHPVVANN